MERNSDCTFVRLRSCRNLFVLILLLLHFSAEGKGKLKAWRSLSRPEKCWTLVHPFKARKVYECAQRARFVTDSLEKAEVLKDGNGGQLDAFRHAYWMALMIDAGLSEKTVRRVGQRHEKGDFINFRKGRTEDGTRTDSLASVMDLLNNESGIKLGIQFHNGDKKISLIQSIIIQIWDGNLSILRKDFSGNYLTCKNDVIDLTQYDGQWFIPKCLQKSNEIAVQH